MGDKGPQPIFRKFNPKDDISGQTMVKSSDARKIRKQLLDDMPLLEPILEELLPKKEKLRVAKWSVTMPPTPPRPLLVHAQQLPLRSPTCGGDLYELWGSVALENDAIPFAIN